MAKLTLQIIGDNSDALGKVKAIKTELDKMGKEPIQIKFASQGLDAVVSKLKEASAAETAAVEAAAKLTNAEARKINAQTKAAQAAEKLNKAQKQVAQQAQETASATERLALTNEQLAQKLLEGAKNTDYLRQKAAELYSGYQQLAGGAQSAATAQDALNQSFAMTIQRMSQLSTQVRSWSSGGGQRQLPPYWDNTSGDGWTFSRGYDETYGEADSYTRTINIDRNAAIDVEWSAVADGATAAAGAIGNAASAASSAQGAFSGLGNQLRDYWHTAEDAALRSESLFANIEKFSRWYFIGGAVSALTGAVKDAIATMKAVDDELVTVRKVTGFTADEMKRVEEQAYKTASAYGVAADAYLESVAAFARAGYKEQSDALAELSTKTQIVGDTTADVANQFLLSVDAAYKYQGSIESLSAVLDGANELDNKYATSIEKIAEGMGIVAPVASQMHVTIDELAAAIGTITAVTQRSGSEAARALRALFLNIAGDTKTEIDEGVTWTTGEIEGLRDVIKLYAKDAYDAAQASEGIIDPMRAMEGLAKSMEEGVLSEQKLIEMVSDIGGKLRTSQLLAIIQNWDMYQSMLQDYAGAIGSADKEVENALDSWTRKTAQLSNATTELISHLIGSEVFKTIIDGLTSIVKALDGGVGKYLALIAAVRVGTSVLATLSAELKLAALNHMHTAAGVLAMSAAEKAAALSSMTLATALQAVGAALIANPLFWGAVAVAAVWGISKAIDAVNVSFEEQKEKLDELNSKYDSLYGAGSEIDTLRNKADELTEAEERRLAVLEAQEAVLRKQIADQQIATYTAWRGERKKYVSNATGEYDSEGEEIFEYSTVDTLVQKVNDAREAVIALNNEFDAGEMGAAEYRSEIQAQIVALEEDAEQAQAMKDAGVELDDAERTLLVVYNALVDTVKRHTTGTKAATDAMEEAEPEAKTLAELMKQVEDGLNEEADAATNAAMQTQFYALQAAIASGQPIDTASAITSLSGLSAQSTNTAAALQALIAVFQQIESMDAKISEYTDLASNSVGLMGSAYAKRLEIWTNTRANFDVAGAFQRAYAEALANMPEETTPPGGGATKTDEMLENYKQIVSLEEQRLSFLEASGASVEEQVEQVKAIQSAMHDEADYLRSIGADEEDILKLSTDWWKYQDKISDLLKETDNDLDDVIKYYQQQLSLLQESGASNEQIEAKMRQIMAVLEQQILALQQTDAYLKGDLATLTQIAQIQTQIAQYQNKINDLYKEETETAQKQEDVLGDIVKLRKNELSYLEESGASTDQIAAKMREIQTALLAQISALKQTDEYLSGNAATMAEIVSLQTQWMQYQNKIKDLYQKELEKAVEKVKDEVLELIDVQEEAAVGPLQKQLDILEAQKKTVEDTRTEEERLLAVEKARVALQNAQNERNIRQYNAQTGQWEWVANAETVSKAQSALEDAEKALADYYTEREISMLKDQISSLETEYDALRDAVSDFAQGVIDGTESYKDAAAYLNTAVYGMSDTVKATAAQAAEAFSGLGAAVEAAAAAAAATMMGGAKAFAAAATAAATSAATGTSSTKVSSKGPYGNSETDDYETLVREYMEYATMDSPYANSYETRADLFAAKAKSTAAGRSAEDVMAFLDAGMRSGALSKQEALDTLYEITGRSGIQANKEKYNVLMDAIEDLEGGDYERKWHNSVYDEDDKRYSWRYVHGYDSGGILPGRKVFRGKKSLPLPPTAELHGSGGLLRGIGGIKATTEDEMVLPPEMTQGLLTAQNSGAFDALLGSLGIVTAAAESVAGIGGGVTRNSIGSQHNGDVYELGSISLSESQARGMTVYDLAQMARGLSLRNA